MTTFEQFGVLLFIKDFSEKVGSKLFLYHNDTFKPVDEVELRTLSNPVVCHNFWLIKDELISRNALPDCVIDLDELLVSLSHSRDIRTMRESLSLTLDIPEEFLERETRDCYIKLIRCSTDPDLEVLERVATGVFRYIPELMILASDRSEAERFLQIELPVFNAMNHQRGKGIRLDVDKVRLYREEVDHKFYVALKKFSDDFDIQPEVLTDAAAERIVESNGFDLSGVSLSYALEYLPIPNNFGVRLLELRELEATRRVLDEISLSKEFVNPIVDIFGTRTSRIIYRNPALQNISKRYRDIIIPSDGTRLSYVDFDQFEVGIMAALSGDPALKKLFAMNDMYEEFSQIMGMNADFRSKAKRLFLSYAYGMSKKSVVDAAVELGVSRSAAKNAFREFARYEEWKAEKEKEFESNKRMETVLGNWIVGSSSAPYSAREKRAMISQVVQGTGSFIFKKAIIRLSKERDFRLILPMHDAVLFEHERDATITNVVRIMCDTMSEALGNEVVGKASVGKFWG